MSARSQTPGRSSALERARGRRKRRAAALVEAAVTIPFFIGIFVALAFVGQLFVEKMRTGSLSKQQAWTYAMQNCDGQLPNVVGDSGGDLNGQGIDFSGTEDYQQGPGGDTASKGFKMATSTIKGEVVNKDKSGKIWQQQKVQTTTWVLCNEKPQEGDLGGMLKFAWTLLTGW